MLDQMIDESGFLAVVQDLARKRRIVGPVARENRFFYEAVEDPAALDLAFNYCVYGPRAFLFPPAETLFTFSREGGKFETTPTVEAEPTAFIGVHPCDINAIRLLDTVFSKDHPDENYLKRREQAFIVGIDCAGPCTDGVFCTDMHGNEAAEGFDVMLYPMGAGDNGNGTRYGVVFGSKRGREWLLYSRKCTTPSAADEKAFDDYQRGKTAAFPMTLKTQREELPDLLERSYDSLLWEATARRCYSCGSCNLSCPTCYCFNIFDDLDMTLAAGERKREWDGCQIRDFATVAGEHNFRPKTASRLRHRIYRKAKWVEELSGHPGCVGCARCDRACTAKISSVEIYNQLAEEA